jgi:Histidine kinase-, DNA gyrase B-, and HSP90-like ATPase
MTSRLKSASRASEDFEAVAVRQVLPDPGVLRAIGLGHSFESAVADLVDNSLDAGASRVLIQFVLKSGLLDKMLLIDDGSGMTAEEVDSAMQLGRPKAKSSNKIGYFGMGLKAATFSQASQLTVLTRRRRSIAEGRRMYREEAGFDVESLDAEQVRVALDENLAEIDAKFGTIVRWDRIHNVPASRDVSVTSAYIESKVTGLQQHLGLVFHRLLEKRSFLLEIQVVDADTGDEGLVFQVEPIDPFAYARSGAPGYPKSLSAAVGSEAVSLKCHIWPGGSDSRFFKLNGGPVESFQGFYLYRGNRLLSFGQWLGVTRESKQRKLARVEIDMDDHLRLFTMTMEKSGVRMVPDLVRAVERASAEDGTTWPDYILESEIAFRESNRRTRRRVSVLPPGQGVPPLVKRAIAREFSFVEGEEPLRIRWTKFTNDDFVEVDRQDRTLWLNLHYREAILKGSASGVNDAPLLKAMLYLLYEDIFRGHAIGPKDKDNMNIWLEILTAAAKEELDDYFD